MIPSDFFSNTVNAYLATLIIASPISEDEKDSWLTLLPLMDDEQKKELGENLREETEDFLKLEKKTVETFDVRIKKMAEKGDFSMN